jgi:trk system potassium uptake protein TrkA
MRIVIIGGGKVGYYLTKTLIPYKHKITLVETQIELCRRIANEFNISVINGDGTDVEHLKDAGVYKADILIAVTGKDENNLIACQLAKRNFGVKRTIARVNNPKNITIFERLGVDTAVSSTSIIADLIEQEIDYSGMKTLVKLKDGKVILNELLINKDSPVCNKSLRDINIPKKCILISVIRDEEVIIPNGYTLLHENDYVIVASSQEDQQALKNYFIG